MTKRNFSSTHAHSPTLIHELCTHIHTVSELVELVALSERIPCGSSSRGPRATARASDDFACGARSLGRVAWVAGLPCGRAGSSTSTSCCALPPAMVSRISARTCTARVAHLFEWRVLLLFRAGLMPYDPAMLLGLSVEAVMASWNSYTSR